MQNGSRGLGHESAWPAPIGVDLSQNHEDLWVTLGRGDDGRIVVDRLGPAALVRHAHLLRQELRNPLAAAHLKEKPDPCLRGRWRNELAARQAEEEYMEDAGRGELFSPRS